MSPLRVTCLSLATIFVGGTASAMVILCDEDGFRIVTTEHQLRAEFSYRHAVAAAAASVGSMMEASGDFIGQAGRAGARSMPAPGATAGEMRAPVRQAVRRDRAAQAITLNNRGLLQLQSGKVPEAIEAFEQAMKLNPGDSRAVMLRGVAAARQGSHEAALGYYNQALDIDPGSVEAYQSRGLSLMKLDRLPLAVADFTKAVSLNPKFEEGFVRRALAYGRLGEYQKAVEDNTAAIAINPKNPLSYNNRAAAYAALGERDKAAADAEAARKVGAAARQ